MFHQVLYHWMGPEIGNSWNRRTWLTLHYRFDFYRTCLVDSIHTSLWLNTHFPTIHVRVTEKYDPCESVVSRSLYVLLPITCLFPSLSFLSRITHSQTSPHRGFWKQGTWFRSGIFRRSLISSSESLSWKKFSMVINNHRSSWRTCRLFPSGR